MQEKGFTLLELMLVIAIITSLTVVGISAYRQQAVNFQVDKTALQLQQWLQAGQAYYQDCGFWPVTGEGKEERYNGMKQLLGVIRTCNGDNKDFPDPIVYMPAGSNTSGPFGNTYELFSTQKANDKLFHIITGLGGKPIPATLVARIAGRMPLAYPVGGTAIDAQVGTVTRSSGGSMITGVSYVASSSGGVNINAPSCGGSLPYQNIYLLPWQFRPVLGSLDPNVGEGNPLGSVSIKKPTLSTDRSTWVGAKLVVTSGQDVPAYADKDNIMLVITTCQKDPP